MKLLWMLSVSVVLMVPLLSVVHSDQTDFNHINSDGSFAFGLKNSDTPGAHYHTASGNPKTIVRGRYGSRQPDTGRVEETVYTAGPRGFRARGPKIHRKQSLSQVPRGPIGTPDDPQADPYDDPSYDFQFKTRNYQRREGSDSNGRVNGLYSYIDDVGEKHSVRYSAGSGTGYEVANPVPDAPNTIAYESPLYKTHKQVRGKVAFESGPTGSGQYKLLSVGPDQRRAETTGPDGVTRGSYSYLDDKGVQRTVQYIAGAGIGYKVVQSTVGAGTHRLPQPNFGINHVEQGGDIGDNNNPTYQTAPSGPASDRPPASSGNYDHVARPSASGYDGGSGRPTAPGGYDPPTGPSGSAAQTGSGYPDGGRPTGQGYDEESFDGKRPTTPSSVRPPTSTTDRSPSGIGGDDSNSREKYPPPGLADDPEHELGGYGDDTIIGLVPPKYDFESASGPGSPSDDGADDDQSGSPLSGPFDVGISSGPSGPAPYPSFGESAAPDTNAYNSNDFASFPEVSYDQKKLEDDRKKDWRDFAKDSTIIKNVGDWYVGLAPGASVRAHIQNIDLLPYGGRAPSPGDALRRDTQAQAGQRTDGSDRTKQRQHVIEKNAFKGSFKVNLQNNNIIIIEKDTFKENSEVNLQNNNIRIIEEDAFVTVPYVNLKNNSLRDGIHPNAFKSVTDLILSNNDLSNFDFLQQLQSLRTLNLSYVPYFSRCATPCTVFGMLRSLEILDLSNNGITELPVGIFSGLGSLNVLNLRNNRISYIEYGTFGTFIREQKRSQPTCRILEVDLSNNLITNLDFSLFSSGCVVDRLLLHGNQITKCVRYCCVMSCATTCEMAPHQNRSKVGNVASTKSSSMCLLVACLLSSGHLVACWNLRDNNYQGNDAYLGRNTAGYGGYRSEEQQSVSVHGGNSGGFERGSQLGASFQGQTAGGAVTDLQRHQWTNGAGSSFATPGIAGGDTQQLNGFNGASDYSRAAGVPAHGGSYQGVNSLGHTTSGATAAGSINGQSAVPAIHTTAGDSQLAGSYAGATAGAGSGFNYRAPAVYPSATGGYIGSPVAAFPHPWKFGPPSVGGGFGRPNFPWYGPTGYLYRPPVAHLNPDGSYSFSYNTPHSNRDETGDGSGNVAGTYGFQNDGSKHNFSFSAGPDVDLRTNLVQSAGDAARAGNDNPANYAPQSVHTHGGLPQLPGGGFGANVTPNPGVSPSVTNGFSGSGVRDDLGSGDGSDQSSLSVIGLPASGGSDSTDVTPNLVQTRATEANLAGDESTTNRPVGDARNTIIDRTTGQQSAVDRTLPNNPSYQPDSSRLPGGIAQYGTNGNPNGPASDFAPNFGAGNAGFEHANNPAGVSSYTTPTPVSVLGVEQVVGRPANDPSYNVNLQAPQGQGVPFGNAGASWNGLPAAAGRPDGGLGAGAGEGTSYPGFAPNSGSGFGTGNFGQQQPGAFSPAGDLNANNFQYNPSANGGFQSTASGVPVSGGFGGFNSNGAGVGPGANSFGGDITNRAGGAVGAAGAGGRMYQFGYSTPDAVREESADARGNVRGSFAYNNAAGRHDLQYVAGTGTGFRPTGGSLSIPNGLSGGANTGPGTQFRDGSFGNTATQTGLTGDGRQFGFDGRLSPTNQGQSNSFGATRHTVTRSPQTNVPDSPYPVPDANTFSSSGDGSSYEEGSGQFVAGDNVEQATVSSLSGFTQ
ncbi:hypothetical protein AND_003298 [Anopheles darlingi]|uniref:Uncharacterized protein n=1 Tax=Anopheles darlingi TaxID=43151 RepID=W5JLF8_ANODA|nr:hypothetical protein AND_003298 [Anopheles darlingi]